MTLHPLQGHRSPREALLTSWKNHTFPPALLFHGPPGVGKQRLALWLGQLICCEAPGDGGPCSLCKGCRLALSLEHPDLHWHFPLPRPKGAGGPDKLAEALEVARGEALAEVREDPLRPTALSGEPKGLYLAIARLVRRRALKRPAMAATQLFILAQAETLVPQESSPEAANALLKLLEEPPDRSRFILTSSEPGRLLPTIRSRTFPLHVPPLPSGDVERFLIEVREAPREEARRAARLAGGSIGRALGFLPDDGDPGPLEELRRRSFHLLRAALSGGGGEEYGMALAFPPSGARALSGVLGFLEGWLRDLAAAAADAPDAIINQDARDYLVRTARERGIHPIQIRRALAPLDEARMMAEGNVNPQLVIAGLLKEIAATLVAGESGSMDLRS